MNAIIEHIIHLSWLMLVLGWILHTSVLLRHIQAKRMRRTTLMWFVRNRPYKFISMALMPLPLGLIEYIIVSPGALDMHIMQDRVIMGTYLAAMLMTGAGSNIVIDKIGVKNAITVIEDDGDDYATEFAEKKNDCDCGS